MPMSWECSEGPGGKYPGESGYEEDLEEYELRQFENELSRHKYDDELPWYNRVYNNFLFNSNTEEEYVVPRNNDYMREQLTNYLFNKHNIAYIRIKKNTKVYLRYDFNANGINIKEINDFKRKIYSIGVSNDFETIEFNRNSINKVVLDIYNDANNKNVENVTKFLREKSKKIIFLKSE
tara:strand:+ start:1489 stop:2025 length:537 start_codon:yes stop_codon:yes gene_type:complete